MKDKIIYSLSVADIQTVALEELDRELNRKEIKEVENHIGKYIDWYDAISNAINDMSEKTIL